MTLPSDDTGWAALAAGAKKQKPLSGFYNINYRLDTADGPLLFRFPKPGEPLMDPRPMRETDIMGLIEGKGLPSPHLLYAAPDGSFHVQQFIDGPLVDKKYPPGSTLPGHLASGVVDFYARVARLDIDAGAFLPPDWPRGGPMEVFFGQIMSACRAVYGRYAFSHGPMYESLSIPRDPFAGFAERARKLAERPWRLVHCDLHRGNMIEGVDGLCVIDWELAMWGDLLYCIAAHIHRTRYFSGEGMGLAARIREALPPEFQRNFDEDLKFYLDYEALKSVLGDTARFPALVTKDAVPGQQAYELCVYFSDNLNRVAPLIGSKPAKPEQVMEWFRLWTA